MKDLSFRVSRSNELQTDRVVRASRSNELKTLRVVRVSRSVNLSPSESEATEARECEPPAKRGRKRVLQNSRAEVDSSRKRERNPGLPIP